MQADPDIAAFQIRQAQRAATAELERQQALARVQEQLTHPVTHSTLEEYLQRF